MFFTTRRPIKALTPSVENDVSIAHIVGFVFGLESKRKKDWRLSVGILRQVSMISLVALKNA